MQASWDARICTLVMPIFCLTLALCGANGLHAFFQAASPPPATSCSVVVGGCPLHPGVGDQTIPHDWNGSAGRDRACMQRYYIAWCLVAPTFFQDGQVDDSKPVLPVTLTPKSSPSPTPPPSEDIVIDAATQFQTMVGFGASDGFIGDLSPEQMDLFFSQDNGIGLSLLRAIMTPSGGVFGASWANRSSRAQPQFGGNPRFVRITYIRPLLNLKSSSSTFKAMSATIRRTTSPAPSTRLIRYFRCCV